MSNEHVASPAAVYTIAVAVFKPATKTSLRRGTKRQFIGVSWNSIDKPPVGVRIGYTFTGLPSAGHIIGGDVILRVAEEPVNSAQDVVFYWDRAAAGTSVLFHLQRKQTHQLVLDRESRDAVLAMGFRTEPGFAPAAILAGTKSTTPAGTSSRPVSSVAAEMANVAQPGDLVLAVGDTTVANADDAAALLRRAEGAICVSVRRDAPDPLDGVEGSDCCLPWLSSVTPVPKAKRQTKKGGRTSTMGDTLLDDDAAFELREPTTFDS